MSVRMLSARADDAGVNIGCGVAVSPVVDWKYYGEITWVAFF